LERRLESALANVQSLRLKATKAGINSTPSWFINEKEVTPRNEQDLTSLIEETIAERTRAGSKNAFPKEPLGDEGP